MGWRGGEDWGLGEEGSKGNGCSGGGIVVVTLHTELPGGVAGVSEEHLVWTCGLADAFPIWTGLAWEVLSPALCGHYD